MPIRAKAHDRVEVSSKTAGSARSNRIIAAPTIPWARESSTV